MAESKRWHVQIEQEEDGRWIGEVEDVPGAMAYGATPEEAAINAAKVAQAAANGDSLEEQ